MTTGLKTWTDALRSDQYKQITGELVAYFRDDDDPEGMSITTGHCCLGVACEAYGLRPDVDPRAGLPDRPYLHGTYANIASVLPADVAIWLGLDVRPDATVDPIIDFPVDMEFLGTRTSNQISCTMLNDELHLNFHQIADLVDYFGIRSYNA